MPSPSTEFPYRTRLESGVSVLVPVVLAELPTPYGVFPIRLVLDSGADCTMLSRALGELAGIDVSSLPRTKVKGIAGQSVEARRGTVRLRIGGLQVPSIPCLYVESKMSPLLLGREGFFDLFNITLDNRRKKTVLTPLF
ncbi:MAG TPA: retropepsin-like aspartic protease [Verrucomicrobiae bacterium]|nr:retropepsin-like aspartic protease [Verrucomicrobiae bacterium]